MTTTTLPTAAEIRSQALAIMGGYVNGVENIERTSEILHFLEGVEITYPRGDVHEPIVHEMALATFAAYFEGLHDLKAVVRTLGFITRARY